MNNLERKSFTWINLSISIIGIFYFIYKYFMSVETEFGIRPHSLTSSLLHLHIISVPILLIFFGYLLPVHVILKLRKNHPNRKVSGITILVLFIMMSISGYLLQMGFGLSTDKFIGVAHTVISFLWVLIYLWHFRMRF